MLMSGIYKMVTGSQCLLFCESIVQRPVFVGLLKVISLTIIDFREFEFFLRVLHWLSFPAWVSEV